MKPITAAIFLKGLPGIDKSKPVENFQFTELKQVKDRLKELQKGYCEQGDRIKIIPAESRNPKTGNMIKCLAADSGIDFSYVAFLGMKIKLEAIKNGNAD